MGGSRQYTALEWIVKEINVTLQESQRVLKKYADDHRDITQLRFCHTLIHQVVGSLRMVGFHGAATLAEEMEALAQALLDGDVRDHSASYGKKEALEVLTRAIQQLPEYLEKVQKTRRDYPALMLSLLNDIRSVRGASLLSESTLFAPNLDYAHQIHGQPHPICQDSQQLQILVGKLRQMYQYAAASIFHNMEVDKSLTYLRKASGRLHRLLQGTRHEAVWEIADAVIDGMHKKIIDASPAIKNLLRDLDGQLKQIEAGGSSALEEYPLDELLKNLLYYVGASDTRSDAITAVKDRYHLHQIMPLTKAGMEEPAIPAIDRQTTQAVAAAIREELSTVRTGLDYCLRNKNQGNAEADQSLDMVQTGLQRVSDTLAMLGIGESRQAINNILMSIRATRRQNQAVTKELLLKVIDTVTNTEQRLDRELSRAQLPSGNTRYLDETQVTILAECRNGLESARDAIVDYIASQWNPAAIEPVPAILRKTHANLSTLSLNRAADILSACMAYVESQLIEQPVKPKWQELDSLADVIASVDYYLEFMSAAHENNLSILDKAEKGLGVLGTAVAITTAGTASTDTAISGTAAPEIVAPATTPAVAEDGDEIDAEIVEIFVEEFDEIRQSLKEFFPRWTRNLNDEAALVEIRRAFHTLKGSGRMVKATDVGELAWSVENMLNRILDYTIPASEAHALLVDKVMSLLPDMIAAFRTGDVNPHQSLCDQYRLWAKQLTLDESHADLEQQLSAPVGESGAATELPDSQPPSAPADEEITAAEKDEADQEDTESIDPQLWEIFCTEAESHLAVIQQFIDTMEQARPLYTPPDDTLQRALHTIKGSAYMAELLPIAELMKPLEQFVKELRSYQVNIDDDIFQLIRDSASYTRDALKEIQQLQYPTLPKYDQFIARLDELRERSVGPLIRQQETEKSQKKVDPAILEMLMTEEMNLLMNADLQIGEWQQNPSRVPDWQPLHEELTRLEHAAKKANLAGMVHLSQTLASVYQRLMDGSLAPSEDTWSALSAGHIELINIMDAIAADQGLPEENSGLLARLDSLSNPAEPSNLPEISDTAESTDSVSLATAESVQTVAAASEPDAGDIEADGMDQEMLHIFLAEAHELLEKLEDSIHQWENGADDRESSEQIQRILHTLKGGARLCGMSDLGNLAHEFEAFLIANKGSDPDDRLFGKIHQFQDQLIAGSGVDNLHQHQHDDGENGTCDKEQSLNAPQKPEVPVNSDTGSPLSAESNIPTLEDPVIIPDEAPGTTPPTTTQGSRNADPTPATKAEAQSQTQSSLQSGLESGSPVYSLARPVSGKSNVVPFAAKNSLLAVLKQPPNTLKLGLQAGNAATVPRKQPQEVVKVSAELMEELVNLAGETSISRGRIEEHISELGFSLEEMDTTVERLREQLRRLDIETDAQISFRHEQMAESEEFDPLEMDRYSQLQQLSRSLIESASDLMDLKSTLTDKTRDTETVLLQQSRINTNLQEGLMRSRMVPFSRIVPRLRRIVRQIANELDKKVNLDFGNIAGELDRSMMERMVTPLEHMLRNAIYHGIEDADTRQRLGKPEIGRLVISLDRDGGDVLIHVADDGSGIDISRVSQKAVEHNLVTADAELNDQEILQFIFRPGFSTTDTITQIAGRGIGMDVVNSEIRQMGGSVAIETHSGEGTAFTIRVPFTVSVNRALMVKMADDRYAVPLNSIEGIVRISPEDLEHYYNNPDEPFEYAGQNYQLRYLGSLMDQKTLPRLRGYSLPLPVLLVRSVDHAVALQVDNLQGSREIVVKSLGPQFQSVQGITGATIMGDGHVVVILDLNALIRSSIAQHLADAAASDNPATAIEATLIEPTAPDHNEPAVAKPDRNTLIMVVDDSVTVRKVTTRLLEREGYDVITARDGVDAVTTLRDTIPDLMLLDIEMPRMDGFEVARSVRADPALNHLPIIMITSRTGEKHRQRGFDAGANLYMGKPYQEEQLLENIHELIHSRQQADI